MQKFLSFFQMPRAAQIICGVSVLALLIVFTMQAAFGIEPCVLCWWQRLPFALAILFSLTAWLWRPYRCNTPILLGLCAACFFVGTCLAIFHTGVEQHWWLGTSGCAIQPLHGASAEDLRTQLLHTVVARCDQVSWVFLGLSLANWNVPFSAVLTIFAGIAALRARQNHA